MTLPADTVFIGRKHLQGHEVHLIKGRAVYITPKGKFEQSAPYSIMTTPGFAMVAYIIEDCIVETWHKDIDASRDIKALEARDFEDPQVCLARGRVLEDTLDYADLTKGLNEKYLLSLYGSIEDLFEEGYPSIVVQKSSRAGVGVFATQDFTREDYIGLVSRGKRRTAIGRWINHGKRPTCRLSLKDQELHLFAEEDISAGEELTIDYRISIYMGARACQVL